MTVAQLIVTGFFLALAAIVFGGIGILVIRIIRGEIKQKNQKKEEMLEHIKDLEKRVEMLQQENAFFKHDIICCLNKEFKKQKEHMEESRNV